MSLPKEYEEDLAGPLFYIFDNGLYTKTDQAQQDAVVSIFMQWFRDGSATLKPVPDLDQRMAAMEPKLRKMAKNLELKFDKKKGEFTLKSDSQSMALLDQLRYGTDWYPPHPSVVGSVFAAALSTPSS